MKELTRVLSWIVLIPTILMLFLFAGIVYAQSMMTAVLPDGKEMQVVLGGSVWVQLITGALTVICTAVAVVVANTVTGRHNSQQIEILRKTKQEISTCEALCGRSKRQKQ